MPGLGSTHTFSDMASFGRSRMMGVTFKRFLTQVKRHNLDKYNALPESLRQRYTPSVHQPFGNTGKDSESRRSGCDLWWAQRTGIPGTDRRDLQSGK